MSRIKRVITVITSLGSLFAVAFSAFGQQAKKSKAVKSSKARVTSSVKRSSSDSDSNRSGNATDLNPARTAPLILLDGKSRAASRTVPNATLKTASGTPKAAVAADRQTLSLGVDPGQISSGVTAEKDISPPAVTVSATTSATTTPTTSTSTKIAVKALSAPQPPKPIN
jgi:hypothetical protein